MWQPRQSVLHPSSASFPCFSLWGWMHPSPQGCSALLRLTGVCCPWYSTDSKGNSLWKQPRSFQPTDSVFRCCLVQYLGKETNGPIMDQAPLLRNQLHGGRGRKGHGSSTHFKYFPSVPALYPEMWLWGTEDLLPSSVLAQTVALLSSHVSWNHGSHHDPLLLTSYQGCYSFDRCWLRVFCMVFVSGCVPILYRPYLLILEDSAQNPFFSSCSIDIPGQARAPVF